MPCRLSSLLLARHVPPQRSIQIYRSVLEILLVIFEFARKKNGDKMFRAQTHQVFICLALSRGGPQGQLARQISRCFWVLDHPFEFALPHLPCTLRFGLNRRAVGVLFKWAQKLEQTKIGTGFYVCFECLFYVCFERALNTPTCFAVLNDADNAKEP